MRPRVVCIGALAALVCAVPSQGQVRQETQLFASDASSGDIFGSGIAISENLAVVGARHDDDNGTDSGAVYLYRRSNRGWAEVVKILAIDGKPGDRFGDFVAIDGELVVVGAPGNPFSADSQGAVYIYRVGRTGWSQEAKLVPTGSQAGDGFGRVVIDGNTVVVSATLDDENGYDAGAVYVFERSRQGWLQQAKLLANDGMAGDHFGHIAINGDTIVVGASRNDGVGIDAGAAYVFIRDKDSWSEAQKLTASDSGPYDRFGESVAIDGDTILIGATGDDGQGYNAGAAYVYVRQDGTWIEQQKLVASDGQDNDGFGHVAIQDHIVVIGAPRNLTDAANNMVAYVYSFAEDTWREQTRVDAGVGGAIDRFGALSMTGSTFAIGSGGSNAQGPMSGAAFVYAVVDNEFDGVEDDIDNCPTQFNPTQIDSNGDGFGDACVDPSVMVSTDVNFDRTVIVGADANFKKDVSLGAYTRVGSNVEMKKGVNVGEQVDIGDGAVLQKDIEVGNAASIGAGVRIGKGAYVGPGSVIGANTVIGKDTVICGAAEIGEDSDIEKNSLVSPMAILSPQSELESTHKTAPSPADCLGTASTSL